MDARGDYSWPTRVVASHQKQRDVLITYNERYTMIGNMTPKILTAFRLDPELMDGLKAIKARTGAPIAEQVRRAIVAWLKKNDVKRSGRKPARQRST